MRVVPSLLGLLAVVSGGCTEVNNYHGCEAVDGGGCGMGRGNNDHPEDHWGDDDLEDSVSSPDASSIFTPDSKLQDSRAFVLNQPPGTLVDAHTKGEVPRLISVNLATPIGELFVVPGGPPPSPAEVVALIDFGVGGTAYQMEVDYGVGVQFALLASRIKISPIFRTMPTDVVLAGTGQYMLGASVGQGVIAPTRPPTRTLGYVWSVGGLAPLADMNFTIPMFAKAVSVIAVANGGAAVAAVRQVEMFNYIIVTTPVAAFPSAAIPLSGDARSINILNAGAVNIVNLRLIFELAL